MKLKLPALFLLAAAVAPAAVSGIAPDSAAAGYLAAARIAWGIGDNESIELVMDPTLNGGGCTMSMAQTEFAFVDANWSTVRTTMTFEDGEPAVVTDATTWRYTIRVNANCRWDPATYAAVILHECGHIMIGAKYHSKDKRSIMYPVIGLGQTITAADRAALVAGAGR
jgi:hypothetical protein